VPTQSIQILLEADKSLRLNNQPVTLQDLSVIWRKCEDRSGLKVTLSADERVSGAMWQRSWTPSAGLASRILQRKSSPVLPMPF